MKAFTVRLSDELHARLVAGAAAAGETLSTYTRSLLEGSPDAAGGVWVAAHYDASGVSVHANEIDALHEGMRGHKDRVFRVPYGDDIIDHLR